MLSYDLLPAFFLVFIRISAFVVSSPMMSFPGIPVGVKVGLSFLLSVVLFPVVKVTSQFPAGPLEYAFALGREAFVGLALGLLCSLVFNCLVLAGYLIDVHIGFFMSTVFDPATGGQSSIIARFMYMLGLALFLNMDGHHLLIAGLAESFDLVPLNEAAVGGSAALVVVRAFAGMMNVAVQIAAPVVAVVLVIDVALGLVGRTAPQLNVFLLGFPIKIAAGIITLSIMIPLLGSVLRSIFDIMERDMLILMKGLT